jgi:hypothetical protein
VDTTTRVVSRHLARFIPDAPRVIVQNMEGAIRVSGVRFDPEKFSYVGSPGAVNSVVY